MLVNQQQKLQDEIRTLVERHGRARAALMPILQDLQARHSSVSDFAMQVVADELGIHPAEVYGVVSFYAFLHHQPRGRFQIRLCQTISCDLAGKARVARQLENELGIRIRRDDGRRAVQPRMGQLPGDVRPGTGAARERPRLHAGEPRAGAPDHRRLPQGVRRARGGSGPRVGEGQTMQPTSSKKTPLTFDTIAPGQGLAAALARRAAPTSSARCRRRT